MLLQRYLAEHGIGDEIPWKHLRETQIDPVFDTIEGAPEPRCLEIEQDFLEIHAMGDEAGVRILIEEGRDPHHEIDLAERFATMGGHLERAFWTFLKHPEVFKVASRFYHADNLPGRSWRKRKDLPAVEPATDQESRERLEEAIAFYYRHKEGRGRECQVDHYRRGEALYWFAYPEDYAEGRLVYDDQGHLSIQTLRPAFEVIFVYTASENSLDLFVRGDKLTVMDLQRVFFRTILGVELDEVENGGIVYHLEGLLERAFTFAIDPADAIDEVRIRKLRLGIIGQGSRRITLEANVKENPRAVYDLLDDVLAGNRIPKELLTVTQVRLQIVFRPGAGRRSRTLSFDVTPPDSCSLKHDPEHEVARQCLKKWELDVSDTTAATSKKRGRTAQYVLSV
jgi:hypothetical protein